MCWVILEIAFPVKSGYYQGHKLSQWMRAHWLHAISWPKLPEVETCHFCVSCYTSIGLRNEVFSARLLGTKWKASEMSTDVAEDNLCLMEHHASSRVIMCHRSLFAAQPVWLETCRAWHPPAQYCAIANIQKHNRFQDCSHKWQMCKTRIQKKSWSDIGHSWAKAVS